MPRYAELDQAKWHSDSVHTFVLVLPCLVAEGAPLVDEAGDALGAVRKVWPARDGRCSARVRLSVSAYSARPHLRADLLACRRNIVVNTAGQLVLAPQIAKPDMSAVRTKPIWNGFLRIVASK